MEEKNIWENEYLVLEKGGPKRKSISLLTGIDTSEKEFILGPIKIRPFNAEIDIELRKERLGDPQHSVLELNYIDRKDGSSMYCEPMTIITKSFQAIQLLVNNWIGMSIAVHLDSNGKIIGSSGFSHLETADSEFKNPEAIIKKNNTIDQRDFINVYNNQGDPFEQLHKPLERALYRFSRACTERKSESILDFVIALEETLGFGLRTEAIHRIASRGAFLLSLKDEEKILYYTILRHLYKIRSDIVHGSDVKFEFKEEKREALLALGLGDWEKVEEYFKSHEFANVTRIIIRKVLLKFIQNPSMLDKEWLLKLELGLISLPAKK